MLYNFMFVPFRWRRSLLMTNLFPTGNWIARFYAQSALQKYCPNLQQIYFIYLKNYQVIPGRYRLYRSYNDVLWKFLEYIIRVKDQKWKLFLAFQTDQEADEIGVWWCVDDMFTFDNIGFRYMFWNFKIILKNL